MPPFVRDLIDDLVLNIATLTRERQGHLAAVTVALPHDQPLRTMEAALHRRLSELGHADVELRLLPTTGPARVLALEFDR